MCWFEFGSGLQQRSYLGGIHLVDSDDELPDTESESEQSMLSGLAVLRNTGLELTSTGGNDENSAIGLGGPSDHVLDEVTVSRGVDDLDFRWVECFSKKMSCWTYSDHVFGSLEFPKGNVNGDSTLTLGLQFVQDPGYSQLRLSARAKTDGQRSVTHHI